MKDVFFPQDEHSDREPSYYAVIPASVRYNKALPLGARLLYGEISALCSQKGFCWARNSYFAGLYDASTRTIINWINALEKAGHIAVRFEYRPDSKEIDRRLIYLAEAAPSLEPGPESGRPQHRPDDEQPAKPAAAQGGGEKIFTTYGKNLHEVVKKFSPGGEKNFTDNITANITGNINSAAAASKISSRATAPPLENKKAAAADLPQNPIHAALTAVDPNLVFGAAFYPRAGKFLAEHGLDDRFFPWLYKQCRDRNPKSLRGMFYTLFFSDDMAALFSASCKPREPPPPAPCPVCGAVRPPGESCPACGLAPDASVNAIALEKALLRLPQADRDEYRARERAIYDSHHLSDFKQAAALLSDLRQEFALGVST